jgi:hypothetical protein
MSDTQPTLAHYSQIFVWPSANNDADPCGF